MPSLLPIASRHRPPPPRVRGTRVAARRSRSRSALGALALAGLGGCATLDADIHLAPLYTNLSTPGGGRRSEFLFGAAVDQEPPPFATGESAVRRYGLRPLWTRWIDERGTRRTHFLAPFGLAVTSKDHSSSRLFPLYFFNSYDTPDGRRKRDFVTIFGFFWSREGEENRWAWFPFYGNLTSFLAYDELTFVAFPLFMRFRKGEEVTHNVLFPVFAISRGGGARDFRVWPLYGRASIEGKYDRRFVLWPLFHRHRNHLEGGRVEPETKWMFFPVFGKTKRGTYRSYTVLWPFFGWARDPRADFWALDAPFPFVRIQRGGKRPTAETRTRFWPFFGHFRGDDLESWTYMWPIVHFRRERRPSMERKSLYILPFLQSWRRVDKLAGDETHYLKLWPFYQREQGGGVLRVAFPDLNPLPHNLALDFHYGWLWEIVRTERDEFGESTRSWGAIWRREQGAGEARTSLTGLYAHRTYESEGRPASAYSLLFGLLRWRVVEGEGARLLRPAFPGPGWPPFEAYDPRLAPPAAPAGPPDSEPEPEPQPDAETGAEGPR